MQLCTLLDDQSPESILGSASFNTNMMLLFRHFSLEVAFFVKPGETAALQCQVQDEVMLSYEWLLRVVCELNIGFGKNTW